jgi:hypothetical protein
VHHMEGGRKEGPLVSTSFRFASFTLGGCDLLPSMLSLDDRLDQIGFGHRAAEGRDAVAETEKGLTSRGVTRRHVTSRDVTADGAIFVDSSDRFNASTKKAPIPLMLMLGKENLELRTLLN